MHRPDYTIVILGPQGSGKGTQAAIIARRFGLVHIDMGALLRRFVNAKHPLAVRVRRIMNEGMGLVPSALVTEILRRRVIRIPHTKGILFDGYPRNITQARSLDRILRRVKRQITHVIYLPISQTTTVKRLALRHREDDTPQAIKKRLQTYHRKTRPVIEYYRKRNVLHTVNGEPAVPVVTRTILKQIHE